jgi:hypothetical protein
MPSWPSPWRTEVPPGYHRAANVVIDYDGGNHSLYGRLLSCDACGSVVLETAFVVHDNFHAELKKEIARLSTASDPRNWSSGWR